MNNFEKTLRFLQESKSVECPRCGSTKNTEDADGDLRCKTCAKLLTNKSSITIEKYEGEYRVPSPDGYEDGAYYSDDKEDAISTAKNMYKNKDLEIKFRTVKSFEGGKYEKYKPNSKLNESKKYSKLNIEGNKVYTGKIPASIKKLIDPETVKDVTGVAVLANGDIWVTEDPTPDGEKAKWNPYDVKRFK